MKRENDVLLFCAHTVIYMYILYAPAAQERQYAVKLYAESAVIFLSKQKSLAVMAVNVVLYLFLINVLYFERIFS